MGMARSAAMAILPENARINTSSPISKNRTVLRISSMSSQNVSRWPRVRSDMANRRPWLPMSRPATTIAMGPEVWIARASEYPPITSASVINTSTL
jgi:hypothetical protein